MDMQEIRARIDRTDNELVRLYGERMELVREIGRYKRENGLPVLDAEREKNLLNRVGSLAGAENESGVRALFSFLMAQSRTAQLMDSCPESLIEKQIRTALAETPEQFPAGAAVACRGPENAYSGTVCGKFFTSPSVLYCEDDEGVFSAVEKGACRYGILPADSLLAGAAADVCDRIVRRHFYIVRSIREKDNRFICIAGRPEIYPGADRTCLAAVLLDRPGSLYQLLGRFNARGINLTQLENRPVPGRDSEFMCCCEMEAPADSSEFIRLIEELDAAFGKIVYLGSYSELA